MLSWKHSLVGTNWVNNGSLGCANAYGLTGVINVYGTQTNVTLFITSGGTASAVGADTGVAKLTVGVDSSGWLTPTSARGRKILWKHRILCHRTGWRLAALTFVVWLTGADGKPTIDQWGEHREDFSRAGIWNK